MNLRFYLFTSGVNRGNEKERCVHDFLMLSQGFESFPSVFSRVRQTNLVLVE